MLKTKASKLLEEGPGEVTVFPEVPIKKYEDFGADLRPNTLYYCGDHHGFIDCNNEKVYDIFNYIRPDQLKVFRYLKEDCIFFNEFGEAIELIYGNVHADGKLEFK